MKRKHGNEIYATVEGRTVCSVCGTDKSWVFSVDQGSLPDDAMEEEIKKAIRLQYERVVDPNHDGHVDKLTKTVKVANHEAN